MKKFLVLFFTLSITFGCVVSHTRLFNEKISTIEETKKAQKVHCYETQGIMYATYDTMDELIDSIVDDSLNEAIQEMVSDEFNNLSVYSNNEAKYSNGTNEVQESTNEFINNVKKHNGIYVPYYNEHVVELRNQKGYDNIILSPEGVYGNTMVGFCTYHNNYIIDIYTTYWNTLVSENTINEAEEKGIEWLIGQIDDNLSMSDFVSDYKTHYEKMITINDKTVNALFIESQDETRDRIYIIFVYNNILVNMFGDRKTVDDWLTKADFREIVLE